MRGRKPTPIFVADFETSVYEGQESTEVWSAGLADIRDTEDNVFIYNNIDEFMEKLFSIRKSMKVYFHNLKFDGTFILHYLNKVGFKQAYINDKPYKDKDMPTKTYKYLISNMGQWYDVVVKYDSQHTITFLDSFKLLPFSLKKLGKDFETKHQKLSMVYEGERYAYGNISDEELEYLKNDVLVLKEALIKMFNKGHTKMTIGSCCLTEYRSIVGKNQFNIWFPHLNVPLPEGMPFKDKSIDHFIRRSYKGGFCYVKKGCENIVYNNGIVLDVNSLYPSVMMSDRKYPIGEATFWCGDYVPERAVADDKYYFIRIRTRFKVKDNHLPTIQIKGDFKYKANEWLETSDLWNSEIGEYQDMYYNLDGEIVKTTVELTLTETDWKLFQDHYILMDTTILGGCYFQAATGNTLFYEYLWHYKWLKVNATNGVDRTIAKLFSNNLYGKMATSDDSSYKLVFFEDGILRYRTIFENEKQTVYIPVGSAITSYAREFTIRTAQKNYKHFIYADTDSLHCDCGVDEMVNTPLDEREYSHWKCEGTFDKAIYIRQKAYVEHIVQENLKDCEPYYNVKYAGMGNRPKSLIRMALGENLELDDLTDDEKKFVSHKLDITDIKSGLIVPSNLKAKNIVGGVLLSKADIQIK